MKKMLKIIGCTALVAILFVGCGTTEEPAPTPTPTEATPMAETPKA